MSQSVGVDLQQNARDHLCDCSGNQSFNRWMCKCAGGFESDESILFACALKNTIWICK